MSDKLDFEPAYIAGLLDGVANLKFDISETSNGTFSVRGELRIRTHGTHIRKAVIGSFLDSRGYEYRLAEKQSTEYFSITHGTVLRDLQEYLTGQSTHLIRELEFYNGLFFKEYDTEILDPEEIYEFLLTRDQLRYGWRPRNPRRTEASHISEKHDFEQEKINPRSIPSGGTRENYSTRWLAGVYDGICRYRPSIHEERGSEIGYGMYPLARLYKSGVNPLFPHHIGKTLEEHDVDYDGNPKDPHQVRIQFSGADKIREILDLLLEDLLVLAEHSVVLLEKILPRFDKGIDHRKQGFYDILADFYPLARDTGGPFRQQKYSLEYFEREWKGEISERQDTYGSL